MIQQGMNTSIIGRAITGGYLSVEAINIRDYAFNKHQKVDDYPYGGGAGMLMQAEPVYLAYQSIEEKIGYRPRVVYLTPQGSVFNQTMAKDFAKEKDLVFLCGHYEGIDERVLEEVVTDFVSIGDYVLTGGELPAMVMMDSISRMVPGVLSNQESGETESFAGNLLEYPQYSRPEEWHGKKVPPVLLSGHHANIEAWRREQSILRTAKNRPDLLRKADLTNKEWNQVRQWRKQWKEENNIHILYFPYNASALAQAYTVLYEEDRTEILYADENTKRNKNMIFYLNYNIWKNSAVIDLSIEENFTKYIRENVDRTVKTLNLCDFFKKKELKKYEISIQKTIALIKDPGFTVSEYEQGLAVWNEDEFHMQEVRNFQEIQKGALEFVNKFHQCSEKSVYRKNQYEIFEHHFIADVMEYAFDEKKRLKMHKSLEQRIIHSVKIRKIIQKLKNIRKGEAL